MERTELEFCFAVGLPLVRLPAGNGPPTTIYNRFVRWAWGLETCSESLPARDATETQMIDSTHIKTHRSAAAETCGPPRCKRDEGWFEQSAQTYPACRCSGRCKMRGSARPDPQKGPASRAIFRRK